MRACCPPPASRWSFRWPWRSAAPRRSSPASWNSGPAMSSAPPPSPAMAPSGGGSRFWSFLGGNHILDLSGAGSAIGVCLLLWGVFTLGLWVSTFRLSRLLFAIFLTLWIAFFLLGGGAVMGNPHAPCPGRLGRSGLRGAGHVRQLRPGHQRHLSAGRSCRWAAADRAEAPAKVPVGTNS